MDSVVKSHGLVPVGAVLQGPENQTGHGQTAGDEPARAGATEDRRQIPHDRWHGLGYRRPALRGNASTEPELFGEVGPQHVADFPIKINPAAGMHNGRIAGTPKPLDPIELLARIRSSTMTDAQLGRPVVTLRDARLTACEDV